MRSESDREEGLATPCSARSTCVRLRAVRVICLSLAPLLLAIGPVAVKADERDASANEPALPSAAQTKFNPPEDRWTISLEAVAFRRSNSASRVLVSRLPGATTTFGQTQAMAGSEAFNSNQFDQGNAAGPRLTLSYRADADHRFELSFLTVRNLNGTQTIGPGNPVDWYVMRAPGFWQTQDFHYQGMTWASSADLHSLEVNVASMYSRGIEWLAGVRWLRLEDRLTGSLTPADANLPAWKQGGCASGSTQDEITESVLGMTLPGTAQVCAAGGAVSGYPPFWTASTTNDLLGLQAGAEGTFVAIGRLSVTGVAKAGVYANRAWQGSAVSMQKQLYDASAQHTGMAIAAQGGIQVRFAFSKHLSAKAGYELLWLDGLALAPGQIARTLCVSTPGSVTASGVDMGSSVLLRGFTAGIEYVF